MYVAKVYYKTENSLAILAVHHYTHLENALADIADKGIMFDGVSDNLVETLGKCEVYYASSDMEIADDFEFRFENGVIVYVGRICTVDEVRKGECHAKLLQN